MTTQSETGKQKPGWDTRTWLIGLIFSNFAGLILALGFDRTVGGWLSRHLAEFQNVVLVSATVVSTVILPIILSGIARRRWLFWPYLPYTTVLCWMILMVFVNLGPNALLSWNRTPATDVQILRGMLVIVCAPLFIGGLVSLIRMTIFANRTRRSAPLVAEEAQHVSVKPGVWPPPPNPGLSANASEAETPGKHNFT